jgi:hypothetical protein
MRFLRAGRATLHNWFRDESRRWAAKLRDEQAIKFAPNSLPPAIRKDVPCDDLYNGHNSRVHIANAMPMKATLPPLIEVSTCAGASDLAEALSGALSAASKTPCLRSRMRHAGGFIYDGKFIIFKGFEQTTDEGVF